jgi:hypothetical protein
VWRGRDGHSWIQHWLEFELGLYDEVLEALMWTCILEGHVFMHHYLWMPIVHGLHCWVCACFVQDTSWMGGGLASSSHEFRLLGLHNCLLDHGLKQSCGIWCLNYIVTNLLVEVLFKLVDSYDVHIHVIASLSHCKHHWRFSCFNIVVVVVVV